MNFQSGMGAVLLLKIDPGLSEAQTDQQAAPWAAHSVLGTSAPLPGFGHCGAGSGSLRQLEYAA